MFCIFEYLLYFKDTFKFKKGPFESVSLVEHNN